MKNSNIHISHNGPYSNISTLPYYCSQTIRNIAVPQRSTSKSTLIEVEPKTIEKKQMQK